MKFVFIISLIAMLMATADPLLARGRHHGGLHFGKHHHDKHYGSGYRHYGRRHRYGNFAGYALGSMILGGIIGSSLSHARHNSANYAERYPVDYNNRTTFLRAADGNCYLISFNYQGKRVLTQVPETNCY